MLAERSVLRALRRNAIGLLWLLSVACNGEPVVERPVPLPDRDDADSSASPPSPSTTAPPPSGEPPVACDVTAPFDEPALVAGLPADLGAYVPRLSDDELQLFFTALVADRGAELMSASRASRADPFGPAAPVAAVVSEVDDHDPSPGPDGLALWFASNRASGVDLDLWVSRRGAAHEAFPTPVPFAAVNTPANEAQPFERDGELWFVSDRAGGWDIFVTALDGEQAIGPASSVDALNSPAVEAHPSVRRDGLVIIFSSDRAGGSFDLYMAGRRSTTSPFGAPTPIAELNSAATDFAGWISPDGCRIYFSSNRADPSAPAHRLYVSQRR